MIKNLPEPAQKYLIPIVLTLIPLLIANAILSLNFDNPEINLTVLERIDQKENISHVEVAIQNIGNVPSTNILLLFKTENSYELLSFESTDTQPEKISNDDKLRISIERLSPQSYVILKTQGPILNEEKNFWVTTDKDTKIVTIPISDTDVGISSVNLTKDQEFGYGVAGGIGVFALFGFRYYNFYRSEYTRRAYLGAYPIKLVRYSSKYLWSGGLILFFTIGIAVYADGIYEPEPISNYTNNQPFTLDSTIKLETFLQVNDPTKPSGTPGIPIIILGVLVMLVISNKDVNLPAFIWSLKQPSLSKVKLKEISFSYLPAKEISITTKKDVEEIDAEIFAVKQRNEIVGLVSKKAAKKHMKKKSNFKTLFDERNDSTIKKDLKIARRNFIVIKEGVTLKLLKKEMENSNKKYAVIENLDGKFVGVVSYNDLFGQPSIFQS